MKRMRKVLFLAMVMAVALVPAAVWANGSTGGGGGGGGGVIEPECPSPVGKIIKPGEKFVMPECGFGWTITLECLGSDRYTIYPEGKVERCVYIKRSSGQNRYDSCDTLHTSEAKRLGYIKAENGTLKIIDVRDTY